MRLGFHLSIAGSLLKAISQAQVLGCQALQIFVQNPRGWKWRPVAPEDIRAFTAARRRAGLGPLMVHLSYLPNLAAADPVLYQRSAARLSQELALARELEADYLVIHPGHGDLTETSFRLVAQALAVAVSRAPTTSRATSPGIVPASTTTAIATRRASASTSPIRAASTPSNASPPTAKSSSRTTASG